MRIIGLLLLLTILLSCSLSTKPDDNDPFSIRLKLVDNSGNTLQGYKVTIIQNNYHGPWNIRPSKSGYRAETTFRYDVVENCRVNLIIYDYFDHPVSTVFDTLKSAGMYQYRWNGLDNNGNSLRHGVYKAVMKYYIGDEVVYSGTSYPYIFTELSTEHTPYVTDINGEFNLDNIMPFPVLYCNVPVKMLDEMGNELGNFVFSDTMKVTIESPNHDTRSCVFSIINGKNILNLNWDTMTQVDEKAKRTKAIPAINNRKNRGNDDVFPTENKFFGNYPNPFA